MTATMILNLIFAMDMVTKIRKCFENFFDGLLHLKIHSVRNECLTYLKKYKGLKMRLKY